MTFPVYVDNSVSLPACGKDYAPAEAIINDERELENKYTYFFIIKGDHSEVLRYNLPCVLNVPRFRLQLSTACVLYTIYHVLYAMFYLYSITYYA